ncbi:MAG: type II secretion system protein GspE [Alphaproteobacteria bacterium]|nr:type II secretion system protein GspE [Alphaproteobacteria bacterium]
MTTLHSEGGMQVKFRIDGDMTDYARESDITATEYDILTNLVMNLAKMDATQKRIPQDGLLPWIWRRRDYEIRTASIPVENFSLKANFNKIQFRLLRSDMKITLDQIGLSPLEMEIVKGMISQPSGMTVCTGPTSSGKTTTIYAILHTMDMEKQVCYTVENPVEYRLPGATQIKVDEKSGNTFQFILKSLMRLDPDIVFIGEMRDVESARMATQISNTGHTVYSTLHTNDSFGAIPRVLDLGLKPGMLAGALIAVFAQRLVRRLCASCKEEYVASEEECVILGVDPSNPPAIHRAHQGGCQVCAGKGYKGRVAIAEILLFDEDLDDVIASEGTKADLQRVAKQKGFKSMKDDGMLKVLEGLTSIEEVSKKVNINS